MPVRTIHAGLNPRYFGRERGVTWYNLVSDRFSGLNAVTVPGTLRDSLHLLAVVLDQETELRPTEIMTDTAGYTDTIFGIFHLLGLQFSPRIADIAGARFWRVDGNADYGVLDDLAANRINIKLIVEHWDDLLRLAGSVKLGVVRAAGLTRVLQTNDRPTRLARALQALGRLIKSLYMLRFIDDETYRRRILVQLNRGESRHQLARTIFHGKRGELRQRYRVGQEDQLGALGLVVNLIVLWNTIYIDAALNQLRAEGHVILDEDVARLSPLGFRHINMLGRYPPIEIRALPEGIIVPSGVPLVQVETTDPRLPWLATFIETALLRAIWYPTTVATISRQCRLIISKGLEKTSEDAQGQLPFKLHDFGARGTSSGESAGLGGMAHLVNFMGTDTMEGLIAARRYYGADMAGFSIPAAEHSTMTSWGCAREEAAYANMLDAFDGEGKVVAVVSDSYDLDAALTGIWGGSLRDKVLARKGTLVVRPDSGDPVETPVRAIKTMWDAFGGTINTKGYRVLDPHVRVIQGDGMTPDTIAQLIDRLIEEGFAIDNIAFGMGGGLLQQVNRDTLSFAMKANAMRDAAGVWHDVAKAPATDPDKASKAGRQAVVLEAGRVVARRLELVADADNLLRPVWRNGQMLVSHSFDELRARAA